MTLQALPVSPPPFYGTTPPASPLDGQEWILPVDGAGTLWRFRYNASSGSAFKWEFCGGHPLTSLGSGDFSFNPTTASTWTDDAGAPALSVPRAGEYEVAFGGYVGVSGGSTQNITIGLWYTPPAGSLTASIQITTTLAVNFVTTFNLQRPLTGAECSLAATALKLRSAVGTAGGNVFFNQRFLKLLPRRVS